MTMTEIMFRGKLKSSIDGKIAEIENDKKTRLLLKSYGWIRFNDLHGKNIKIVITLED